MNTNDLKHHLYQENEKTIKDIKSGLPEWESHWKRELVKERVSQLIGIANDELSSKCK